MLQVIIGQFDYPSAIVMVSFFVGIGICFTVYFTNRKTKEDYEIKRMELQNSMQENMYIRESNRIIETKKIEQNLITSHREHE